MSNNINLIQGENKVNINRRNRTLVLKIISIVFLSSVALFSIVLLILNSRISVDSVKSQESDVLKKISLLSQRGAKFNLLNDRLRGIISILNSRKNYVSFLNAVISMVPQDASMTALTVDKDGVLLTVSSSSLLPINKFLTNIITASMEKHLVRNIVIEGLTVDKETGVYSISIKAKAI